jgi:hypothetical protein
VIDEVLGDDAGDDGFADAAFFAADEVDVCHDEVRGVLRLRGAFFEGDKRCCLFCRTGVSNRLNRLSASHIFA